MCIHTSIYSTVYLHIYIYIVMDIHPYSRVHVYIHLQKKTSMNTHLCVYAFVCVLGRAPSNLGSFVSWEPASCSCPLGAAVWNLLLARSSLGIGPGEAWAKLVKPKLGARRSCTVDSNKLEHGCTLIYDGFPCVLGLGLQDGHVATS